jgi:hypothetical protein
MIAINIKGLFIATQEAVRHMREGGRIINIGTISSDFMPLTDASVYAMTKGAVASLTRGLARELGPRGITINNVQPGRIDTEMLRLARMDVGDELSSDKMRGLIAVQRYGTCDEVAGLVAYLAGPEAAYVTGTGLKIDGGTSRDCRSQEHQQHWQTFLIRVAAFRGDTRKLKLERIKEFANRFSRPREMHRPSLFFVSDISVRFPSDRRRFRRTLRAGRVRDGGLKGIKTIVEWQQCMLAKRNDDDFVRYR